MSPYAVVDLWSCVPLLHFPHISAHPTLPHPTPPAEYGVTSNATVISVTNTVRVISSLGRGIVINGYAVQSPDIEGSLQVVLGPSADPEDPQTFTESNYWIIGLGPINADGLWALLLQVGVLPTSDCLLLVT